MIAVRQSLMPAVGEWYLDSETEEEFEVVDLDEESGLIELQYLNGEIGELDLEEWESLELSKIEPQEDWTAALEPLEEGDAGYDAESFEQPSQHKPLPGYEQEDVLLSKEADVHEDILGSEPEDQE
jgi:hypothetical protein